MKDLLPDWPKRLTAIKDELKARGEIGGDADLAQRISELLSTIDLPEVERGAVNHWLNGKRQPSIAQFVALCFALKAKPGEVIDNAYPKPASTSAQRVAESTATIYELPDSDIAEIAKQLANADTPTRKMAIAAARGVLSSATPPSITESKAS